MTSKYHFELWTPSGELIADLSGRAKNRHITMSRNEAEDIQWQVPLADIETYARSLGTTSDQLIQPGITEVRIRRGSTYLCGGKITYRNVAITDASQDLELRASGFLNLFKKRYTDDPRIFTATDGALIAATLINETQALPNGDFGVTIGLQPTTGDHDRTYQRTNLKDALQALTTVETFPFDFGFTADKIFNIYTAIGSQRPEIVFEYPGTIKSLNVPMDATNLANEVIALGSGSGSDGNIQAVVDDQNSQINYTLQQEIYTDSSVIDDATLQDHGNVELAAWAWPFELPAITVDGNVWPYVTDYGIGDYVKVRAGKYDILSHINAMYRIEMIDLTIDDDDSEEVTLTLSL